MAKDIEYWVFNNLDFGDNLSIFFAEKVYEKTH